jgi:hypothetical protein
MIDVPKDWTGYHLFELSTRAFWQYDTDQSYVERIKRAIAYLESRVRRKES